MKKLIRGSKVSVTKRNLREMEVNERRRGNDKLKHASYNLVDLFDSNFIQSQLAIENGLENIGTVNVHTHIKVLMSLDGVELIMIGCKRTPTFRPIAPSG